MQPIYILYEARLRDNLRRIRVVADETGVDIILALKAYALWKTFPVISEYVHATTASSPNEARMAHEYFGTLTHTYSPAYEPSTFAEILSHSSHVTFNSLAQYDQFLPDVLRYNEHVPQRVHIGLRVNPLHSPVQTALYNPCVADSRLGIPYTLLPQTLPAHVSGLHVHCLCESSAADSARAIAVVRERLRPWLGQVSWLNLGGGHLMTAADYDTPLLVGALKQLRVEWPGLRVILEPGSAFLWGAGDLFATVVDIVGNGPGFMPTAILNVSPACHMPDTLEQPYTPPVKGAIPCCVDALPQNVRGGETVYYLGGNSCLAGDRIGPYRFEQPLHRGDVLVIQDQLHYTTVKTHMFNGVQHPDIVFQREDGSRQLLRHFSYEDYLQRMD